MSKERLVAFTDAVIAIIMTILVLELKKPASLTWDAVFDLRMNFFAYTVSFFWIGTMWVNMHRAWDRVEKINNKLVWISMLLLFFSSFFPYTTSIVADNFNSSVAQTMYGIVVLLVTFTNVWMYEKLSKVAKNSEAQTITKAHNRWMSLDIVIKLVGMVLTLTVFPPGVMLAVLVTAVFIVLPRSI
ncbi:TMEM175 family protein [Streptococcus oralis]|uniref:Membrane protein n=1 Tax=Streptococcus oralis TaxID=1303 RepID=A0A4V6LNI0_STROR|nr:TMEM175 family protein [Streptococcus oralis]VTT05129.1 membrane protein [Streptococcus oralis]